MNFQDIKRIPSSQDVLDIAFKKSSNLPKKKRRSKDKDVLEKHYEINKLETAAGSIMKTLNKVAEQIPSFDNLSYFYQEIIKNNLDIDEIKKSASTLKWAASKVSILMNENKRKLIKSESKEEFHKTKSSFYGRVSSVLSRLNKHLTLLEEARLVLRQLPDIKEDLFTVCIFGFPNVGKSTLLSKLTTSKPEIQNYPFTTKILNIGYMPVGLVKLQLIDTPGTLNRFSKMNFIEKQANLAIKFLADLVIFVYDYSGTYDINEQIKLEKNIQEYSKKTIYYLSKTDILKKEVINAFLKMEDISNKEIITNHDNLKNAIIKCYKERKN